MSAKTGKTSRVLLPRNVFVDMIANNNKSVILSMLYRGKPKMRVTDNPYRDAIVQHTITGGVNWSYEDMVNRRIVKVYNLAALKAALANNRSGNSLKLFYSKPRKWGVRRVLNGRFTAIVDHKGKEYLTIAPTSFGPKTYYDHGTIIPECVLKPFLYERDPVALVKSQGLLEEDAVKYEDVGLYNIMTVTMNHTVYDLV